MMNTMSMVGMNPAAGVPVGAGMAMMNNGAPATPSNVNTQENMKQRLNTYIYDYFLKLGYHEHARALALDDKFNISLTQPTKTSPGRRRDGELNGVDDNSMDTDSKDDLNMIPNDLPRPDVPNDCPQSPFLFDWFCLFHDIFQAQRRKTGQPGQGEVSSAHQYLQQTQTLQRLRENQQNAQLMRGPQMMPGQVAQYNMRTMRNGMVPNEMQKAALARNMTPQQLQQLQHQKQQQQQQQQMMMQREHSDIEMNGHRPQSPAETENAGSPSKRPRLGDQQFNGGQMAPNGRGQGVPGVPPQSMGMLMQNGINPKTLGQGQFQGFQNQNPAVQQKTIQVYAQNLAQHHNRSVVNQGAMPNGMMNPGVMANQGSPMLQPMSDGQFMQGMQGMQINALYNADIRGGPAGMQTGGAQGGNHALQDYQMQLMLLEQQNKKRLMMARQEQDSMTRADGGPQIPGQPGMQPPGMSPSGSRTGASPNPSDQMKRGTPQLGGLPGSPAPGDIQQGRASPAAMNFQGGMGQDFSNTMLMKNFNEGMVGPGGPGMRPPTTLNPNINMEMARAQQAGRMPGGNWQPGPQGQPMIPQPSQGQPQPMGTPQQRNNEMPPPQAPAAGASAGRTQPSSPQPGQAPPTPSQSNKPNPKGKKEKQEPRKRPNKKGSTTNAPAASEPEPPATPTPSTPITPQHPSSFTGANGKGPGGAAAGGVSSTNPAPTSNPGLAPPQPQVQQQPDPIQSTGAFGDFSNPSESFNLDFSNLENTDVLENFDFDSFLNTDDSAGGFSFDPNAIGHFDSLEAAGGE